MKRLEKCPTSLQFVAGILLHTQLSAADPVMKLLGSGFAGGGTASAGIPSGEIMTLDSERTASLDSRLA